VKIKRGTQMSLLALKRKRFYPEMAARVVYGFGVSLWICFGD
jgi:hypothetical protein